MSQKLTPIAAALGTVAVALALAAPAMAQVGTADKASAASTTNPCDEHFFATAGRKDCAPAVGRSESQRPTNGSASAGSSIAESISASRADHCDEHYVGEGRRDCLVIMQRDQAQGTAPGSGSAR